MLSISKYCEVTSFLGKSFLSCTTIFVALAFDSLKCWLTTCSFFFKWQCRLIFESKFWKKFKVNNHHSGVTYGCTRKYWTVEIFFFQSLPRHLADTVEDVKNQPHGRWKIVFFIFQRKWPKFKKWVWPVKIPWKLSILCL